MLFRRMMGVVPLGVGLTALGFAWTNPMLPAFFRLFFSFVALGFVMTGMGIVSGRAMNPEHLARMAERMHARQQNDAHGPPSGPVGYTCPNCGATLGAEADVSPHGDAKCAHCERWFNIHSRSAG